MRLWLGASLAKKGNATDYFQLYTLDFYKDMCNCAVSWDALHVIAGKAAVVGGGVYLLY